MKEIRKQARDAYKELIDRVGLNNITCGQVREVYTAIGCTVTEADNALDYWQYSKQGRKIRGV